MEFDKVPVKRSAGRRVMEEEGTVLASQGRFVWIKKYMRIFH